MKKSIIKASAIVFGLSLVAKIIGFVKSIIQASYFGASLEMDAFNVASGFVSNVLYMLTTAVSVAFVPIYIQHKKENNERFIFSTRTFTSLGIVCILISGILACSSPIVVRIISPSFDQNTLNLTVKYFNVLLIGIVFSFLANMYTSILNAEKRYAYSTVSSIVNSIVLILFIFLLSDHIGIWSLVFSVPVSFFLQWLILLFVGRKFAILSIKYGLKDKDIKILLVQAMPILLSQATVEINQVVDRALLSGVTAGALTAVSYAAVLHQFASTMISAPLSTVIFTELAEAGAEKDKARIQSLLEGNFKVIILFSVPVVLVMILGAYDIVNFIYGRGKFNLNAVYQCSQGLQMYGLCLVPGCFKIVFSRAYYGLNDTKRPMIIGALEVALNIILSVLLSKQYGIFGIVGATAISCYVFIIVMIIDFNKTYIKTIHLRTIADLWKVVVSTVAVLVSIYMLKKLLVYSSIINVILLTLVCFIEYFTILLLLRETTIITILNKIKLKLNI